ncbi:MAG: hypothetical protein DRO98_02535 [Archaeoglobales archaeon]|nr:MAG: hypothetical protein DRO98_02535 [Archaeoglobales archaeon]
MERVGRSVSEGNTVLPILAVVAGILFLYICKRSVDEIMEDERVQRVSEKLPKRHCRFLLYYLYLAP